MIGFLILAGVGILSMLAEIFKFKKALFPIVLLGVAAALGANVYDWNVNQSIPAFENMVVFDNIALAFSNVILITALLWFVLANDYFEKENSVSDHFALVIFSLTGALMLTSFTNMTTLFLGVEILSIPLYVLAASHKHRITSNEAGFKYLIMGSFASGFLLMGITLIYGATGSFDLAEIQTNIANVSGAGQTYLFLGIVLLVIAMSFKVSLAPFHFWTPDVYQGSPTLITALMSTIVKTAAFAAIFKLFVLVLAANASVYLNLFAGLIALSLVLSNLTAVLQTNVKRMLAYSSISHAATMMMLILSYQSDVVDNLNAMIYYALAYSLASIAVFGVLYSVTKENFENITSFNGLGKRNGFLAICMTIGLLSLAGIPITAGFFGKFYVFTQVAQTPYIWLLILAILGAAVGVYYYFKIIIAMYFKEENNETPIHLEWQNKAVILITTLAILAIGILPNLGMRF